MSADLTPEVLALATLPHAPTCASEVRPAGYRPCDCVRAILVASHVELARIRAVPRGGVTSGELRALVAALDDCLEALKILTPGLAPDARRITTRRACEALAAAPALFDALDAQAAAIFEKDAEIFARGEALAVQGVALAKAKERDRRLVEALRDCVEDMETLCALRNTCGDPDEECPLQDAGKPGNTYDTAKRGRAALAEVADG